MADAATDWRSFFKHPTGDLIGGLTAAIIALPLALAFGVASGLGAIAGLYGAIACGIFAALFGGTPGQVSGPTGPMTVVAASLLLAHPDQPGALFAAIIIAGLLQIVLGVLRRKLQFAIDTGTSDKEEIKALGEIFDDITADEPIIPSRIWRDVEKKYPRS